MSRLSESNLDAFLTRFRRIAPEAKPLWGTMTVSQMLGHLNGATRYSMGYGPDVPFKGNWKTKYVFAPLILNGFRQIPRNVRAPRNVPPTDGDVATLEATLHELLDMVRESRFNPPHHPFFGMIGPAGWMKFHGYHMDHHLRQFGA